MLFSKEDFERDGKEPSAAKSSPGCRVTLALAGESKDQLLAYLDPARFPEISFEWADISGDLSTWEDCLVQTRPDVLLTGWGTPAIPERFATSPDLGLRYVCHLVGSVRQLVPRSLLERGVLVSNWGRSVSGAVAEHAMLLVLAALRNLPAWAPALDRWTHGTLESPHLSLGTRTLRGKRVGLHGFGGIAQELVRMLRAFGAEVSAYSAGVPESLYQRHDVRPCESLEALFSSSEVLIECEALTPANERVVNEEMLNCLPAGAVFVNVGRGRVVDEGALARVAAARGLRLGLDVYDDEPLPGSSPLRAVADALFSPHIAGPTTDLFPGLCKYALANLRRFVRGEEPESLVSLDMYDRST